MTLARHDLRRLAAQACVEAGAPDAAALDQADERTWLVTVGTSGAWVDVAEPPAVVLGRLIDTISEYGSEEPDRWGVAMPACPGHAHPALVNAAEGVVVLTCPSDGREVRRIAPVVAS